MKLTFPLIVSLFFSLISSSAFSVINGLPADNIKFQAIGSLKIGSPEAVSCTATLVAKNWIITADHCTHAMEESEEEGSGSLLDASAYEFRLGYDFFNPTFKTKIKRWVHGPEINDSMVDVAFGELVQSAPVEILPLKLWTKKWTPSDTESVYTHIGYGVREPFTDINIQLDSKRQQAVLKITSLQGNALMNLFGTETALENYLSQFHPQSMEASALDAVLQNGELLSQYSVHSWDSRGRENLTNIQVPSSGWQDTCFGDSGGPLLREINGDMVVVGVVSSGMDTICSPIGTKFTIFGPEVEKIILNLGLEAI